MRLELPNKELLRKTGSVDYYYWNYKFPISLVQKYRFKAILGLLNGMKVDSLLEIGTGSGIFLPQLSKYCENLYACDIHNSYSHIEYLCELHEIQNYHLSQQSVESTNYPDNHFDLIIGVSVLEFVQDLDKAILEIKRILKDDGCLLTILPMKSKILDSLLSIYTTKSPQDEFINNRELIAPLLESQFNVINKGYMIPVVGKYFPVYTHYKLMK